MKVLIVMDGYFPGKKYGGPPISVDNLCSLLCGSNKFFIVTHNHDMNDPKPYVGIKENVWVNRGNAFVKYLSNKDYKKSSFESIIKEIRPDVLYLQGVFQKSIIPCLFLSKKFKIGVLLASRGELCEGALKKKYKKIPYILFIRLFNLLRYVTFQSTSEEETSGIVNYLHANKDKVYFLPNVPSLPKQECVHWTKKRNVARFVFLSRIHPKKNLIRALSFFKKTTGVVTFDIYGPVEDEAYWRLCQNVIANLPDSVTVHYCGDVLHEDVHEVFSRYDAFLFPTFSENYGHVIAESFFAGTPVIISNNTPWKNLFAHNAGWNLSLDDDNGFVEAIQSIIDMDNNSYQLFSKGAKDYIFNQINVDQLKKKYESVIEKTKGFAE